MTTLHKATLPHALVLAVVFWCAPPAAVVAKRIPAPAVEPVVYLGVRYTVPNDKGTRGYIVASEAVTGKRLWQKTIFRKWICPCVEHDVQWVFIKQMRLEAGRLIVVNERGRIYSLDLTTRKVRKLEHIKHTCGRLGRACTPCAPWPAAECWPYQQLPRGYGLS